MFEKPHLMPSGDGYCIQVNAAQPEKLEQDLRSAGFEEELTRGDVRLRGSEQRHRLRGSADDRIV